MKDAFKFKDSSYVLETSWLYTSDSHRITYSRYRVSFIDNACFGGRLHFTNDIQLVVFVSVQIIQV